MSYTRVQWVQTNKVYFDTGLGHSTNPKLFADFEIVSLTSNEDNGIIGVWATGYNSSPSIMFLANERRKNFSTYVGGAYNDYACPYTLNERWQGTLDKTGFKFQNLTTPNTVTGTMAGQNLQASTYTFRIGTRTEGNTTTTLGTFKFFEVIIYENDVEVGHYLPYRDNETGYGVLYDTVSGNYLSANVPSGATAGDPLYDEKTSDFTSSGGTDTYSLETETSWNAVSDSNWIAISPSSGTGNATLTITVGKNRGSAERTGTVTVTDGGGNTLLIWTVEQGYRAIPILNIIYNNENW